MLISSAQRSVIHRALKESGAPFRYPEAEFAIDAIGREMDTDIISVRHTRQQTHLFNTYRAICQKDHVADLNALTFCRGPDALRKNAATKFDAFSCR